MSMEEYRERMRKLIEPETTDGRRVIDSDAMCTKCGGVKSEKEKLRLSLDRLPYTPCLCPPPPKLDEPPSVLSRFRWAFDFLPARMPLRDATEEQSDEQ